MNTNDNMSKAAFDAALGKFGFKPVTLLVPNGEQKVMCRKCADEREVGERKVTVKAHIYMNMSDNGMIDFKVCTLKDLAEMGFIEESLSSSYFYPHQTVAWRNHVTCIEEYFIDMETYVSFMEAAIIASLYDLHMGGEYFFWQVLPKKCLELSKEFRVGINALAVAAITQDGLQARVIK